MSEETERLGLPTGQRELQVGRWLAGAVGILILLLAAGLYAWRTGSRLEELATLGYPGVFLLMLISGGGIFLPIPAHAGVMIAGALWNPALVGLVAGLGNSLGEFTGYAAARLGVAVLRGRKAPRWWSPLEAWLGRHGFCAILALALVPNPLFDAVGFMAGALGYSPRRFWLACFLGNSAKYMAIAYLGVAVRWWIG